MNTKGGLAKGKSHREGGIKATVKSTGQNIEFEGGEIIINKKNVADPKKLEFEGEEKTTCEILSDLNSRNNNGVTMDCDSVEGKKYKYDKGGEISKSIGGVENVKKIFVKGEYPNGDDFYKTQFSKNPDKVINDWMKDNRGLDSYTIIAKLNDGEEIEIQEYRNGGYYAEGGEVQKSKLQEMFEVQQRGSMREKAEFLKNNPEIFMGKVFEKGGMSGFFTNINQDINSLIKKNGSNINLYTLDEKVLLSKYNPDGVFPSDEQALMMWQLAMKYSGKIDIENCIIPNSCGADKLISQAPIDLKHIDVFSNTKKDYLINDIIYGKNFLSENNRIKLYETDKETYRRLDFSRNFIQNPSRLRLGTDCIITNLNDANHVSSTIAEDLVMRNIELADYLKTNGIIVSAYPLIHTITDTNLFDKQGSKPNRASNVLKNEFNRKLEIVKVVQMSKDGFSFLNFPIEIIILKKR